MIWGCHIRVYVTVGAETGRSRVRGPPTGGFAYSALTSIAPPVTFTPTRAHKVRACARGSSTVGGATTPHLQFIAHLEKGPWRALLRCSSPPSHNLRPHLLCSSHPKITYVLENLSKCLLLDSVSSVIAHATARYDTGEGGGGGRFSTGCCDGTSSSSITNPNSFWASDDKYLGGLVRYGFVFTRDVLLPHTTCRHGRMLAQSISSRSNISPYVHVCG